MDVVERQCRRREKSGIAAGVWADLTMIARTCAHASVGNMTSMLSH